MLLQRKTMPALQYMREAKKASRVARGMSKEDFEAFFWDNLHLPSPLYGCDVKGSLFDAEDETPWNLRNLDSCLQDGLGKTTLDGINAPYLYFGNFRSMFAWHVEDLNLASINFQHYGKPKYWYGISKKVVCRPRSRPAAPERWFWTAGPPPLWGPRGAAISAISSFLESFGN